MIGCLKRRKKTVIKKQVAESPLESNEEDVLKWVEEQFSKRFGAPVKLCAFDCHSVNIMIRSMESYINVIQDDSLKEHAANMLIVFYKIEESFKIKEIPKE